MAYTAAYSNGTYEIQTVEDLELSDTGVLTEWNGINTGDSTSNFTVGGAKYNYNPKAYIDVDGTSGAISDFEVDESELNVYLDQYGYALYVAGTEAEKNYAVVIGAGSSNTHGSATFGATLLMPDGSRQEVTAVFDTADNGSVTLTGGDGVNQHSTSNPNLVSDYVGDLVTYHVNKDGEYELTVAGLNAGKTAASGEYTKLVESKDVWFTNGRSLLVIDGNSNDVADAGESYFTTDKTLFFVATNSTGKVAYNVYEGYKNMPSLNATNYAVAFVVNSEYTTQVDAVYIAAQSLKGMSADATFVVKQFDHTVVTDSTGSYFVMPAIVDNEVTTVKVDATKFGVDGGTLDNVGTTQATGVFNMTDVLQDEDGIITDATFNAAASNANFVSGKSYYTTTGLVAANNGVIGLGSDNKTDAIYWAYTEDTDFYEVSEDMKTVTKVSATNLSTDGNDEVFFVADDDATSSWKVVKTVIVQKMKDSASGGPTGSYIVSSTVGVTINGGVINTSGSSIYGSTTDAAGSAGNAALTNVVVTYTVYTWNTDTNAFNAIPTVVRSAVQANVPAAQYIDAGTNAQASIGIPDGVYCQVVVSVTLGLDSTSFAPIYTTST